MPIISENTQCITMINVFTVVPANQQKLIGLLTESTETSIRHIPGFISASFHRSLDGTKVTAYAQWQSIEHYQAMRDTPDSGARLEEIRAIATFAPGMYEVVKTFTASDKT